MKKKKYQILVRMADPDYLVAPGKRITFEKNDEFIMASCEAEVIGLASLIKPDLESSLLPEQFEGVVVECSPQNIIVIVKL